MSLFNSNLPFNECDKYFNQESNECRLFSKQNSQSNLFFNYRPTSNFSLFGKNSKSNTAKTEIKKVDYNQSFDDFSAFFAKKEGFEEGKKQEKLENLTKKISLKKKSSYKKKTHRKKNVFKSLANRNLKLNMGTGLIQFIDFKRSIAKFKRNLIKYRKYDEILQHIVIENFNFRSFLGWKSMWNDQKYGNIIKKLSQQFFGETFVYSYIFFSKIKPEYKNLYYSKIESFRKGSINPEMFGPYLYNHNEKEKTCD